MSIVRRVLAAGGWLAHMANQSPFLDNWEHDRSIRARWIFFWLGLLGILAALPGSASPEGQAGQFAAIIATVMLVGLDVLMVLGWECGFVPFALEPSGAQLNGAGNARPPAAAAVRITGIVVDTGGRMRRYRNRPGHLDLHRAGLGLAVAKWLATYSRRPIAQLPCARVELPWPDASEMACGRAYLVTKVLPALRLTTQHGGLILAFETQSARDDAFAAIAGRRRSPPSLDQMRPAVAVVPSTAEEVIGAAVTGGRGTLLDQTLGNRVWLQEVAWALIVGSVWRFFVVAGPGEPPATVGAVGLAWFVVTTLQIAARSGWLRRPRWGFGPRLVQYAVVTALLVAPLYFQLGRGQLSAVVMIALCAVVLLAPDQT